MKNSGKGWLEGDLSKLGYKLQSSYQKLYRSYSKPLLLFHLVEQKIFKYVPISCFPSLSIFLSCFYPNKVNGWKWNQCFKKRFIIIIVIIQLKSWEFRIRNKISSFILNWKWFFPLFSTGRYWNVYCYWRK